MAVQICYQVMVDFVQVSCRQVKEKILPVLEEHDMVDQYQELPNQSHAGEVFNCVYVECDEDDVAAKEIDEAIKKAVSDLGGRVINED